MRLKIKTKNSETEISVENKEKRFIIRKPIMVIVKEKLEALRPWYEVTINKQGKHDMKVHVRTSSYSKAAKKVRKHFKDHHIVKVRLLKED